MDDSDSAHDDDKTYREYKAKQEERWQQLINRGSIVQPPVKKVQVALRDKLGKEKYVRGENNSDTLSRELYEWRKEINCTNAKGIKFEQCRDSSAKVFEKEVIYGSHTYELNPNMITERFSF